LRPRGFFDPGIDPAAARPANRVCGGVAARFRPGEVVSMVPLQTASFDEALCHARQRSFATRKPGRFYRFGSGPRVGTRNVHAMSGRVA
jgi:hypothetical protein